jgi:uncharacterized protein YbjT (DUF2867 family)
MVAKERTGIMPGRRVLVTGATGYVGGRLVPALVAAGADVAVLVRSPQKLGGVAWSSDVSVHAGDAAEQTDLAAALEGVHTAVYLLHSIGTGPGFQEREQEMAETFSAACRAAGAQQVVYLGGIANSASLSVHLDSRRATGRALRSAGVPVLELRAGMVLGSGSASFEMLRYLTEHLPAMVTPRWATNRTQPIAVRDVIHYLVQACLLPSPQDDTLDIAGPDVLTFVEMMHRYARVAGLRRRLIFPVPLLTPRLSSLWVGLVTPVPSSLARPLIDSLVAETVASPANDVRRTLGDPPGGLSPFEEAVSRSLLVVGFGQTPTRWSDADVAPATLTSADPAWAGGIEYQDVRVRHASLSAADVWPCIERIGGENGWYGLDWAWGLRGAADRLVGGVGLRRGRRDPERLRVGDGLDFWRVEVVDRPLRLLLRAEMRLPGVALLEFTLSPGDEGVKVSQRALFRPRGLAGHIYWWVLWPVHAVLFPRMLRHIVKAAERDALALRAEDGERLEGL